MKELTIYGWIALILVIIGGINLGIYGLIKVDIISGIFGNLLGRLIFIVIGIAAGYICYLLYTERSKKPV